LSIQDLGEARRFTHTWERHLAGVKLEDYAAQGPKVSSAARLAFLNHFGSQVIDRAHERAPAQTALGQCLIIKLRSEFAILFRLIWSLIFVFLYIFFILLFGVSKIDLKTYT
jgi:hypothetical protein